MIVFNGSTASDLAWEITKANSRLEQGKREIKRFPDGELYVKLLSPVKGRDTVLIQSPRSSDELVELFLLLSALRENHARETHVVLPYMTYMRQDKKFMDGEPVSAKTMLKLIDELADTITLVNCHFLASGGEYTYHGVNIKNLDAVPLITQYLKSRLENPFVVAPDSGSLSYAKKAAELLDCSFDHLVKKRVSGEEVTVYDKKLDVKEKDVLLLDDIISTGDTIAKAAGLIRKWKPTSVNVGCVHGLFLNGVDKLQSTANRLVASNTLPNPVNKVSVADLIANEILSK